MNECVVCHTPTMTRFCCPKHRSFFINHITKSKAPIDIDQLKSESSMCESEDDWRRWAIKWCTDSKGKLREKLLNNELYINYAKISRESNIIKTFMANHPGSAELSFRYQFTTWSQNSIKRPCAECGGLNVKLMSNVGLWREFCSNSCANAAKKSGGVIRQRIHNACMDKYGNLGSHYEGKTDKAKATKLDLYGDENYSGDGTNKGSHRVNKLATEKLSSREWLVEEFEVKGRSTRMISEECECSVSFVLTWIHKHGIHIEPQRTSSLELFVHNILDKHNIEYVTSYRPKFMEGKEIDVFVPSLNVGIEMNGSYWHSDKFKGRSYHKDKKAICELNNVRLMHFYETDVVDRPHIIESMILNAVRQSNERIYARKTDVRLVSTHEAKAFTIDNHFQGHVKFSKGLAYGLYHNDELVQIITMGKSRFDKGYDWELLRLCSKLGTSVVGGASKLIKAFRRDHSGSILSYARRDYSDGNVYEKIGFEKVGCTIPNYIYFNPQSFTTYKRYQCMKHKLPNVLGDLFDASETEQQNMTRAGYVRVYDSGNIKYILK